LRDAENRVQERIAVAKELTKELEERTAWALRLDKELNDELEERTAWALRLDKELAEQAARAQELNLELERLAWARILYRFARKVYRRVRRLRSPES
jgi:hypothetical protein